MITSISCNADLSGKYIYVCSGVARGGQGAMAPQLLVNVFFSAINFGYSPGDPEMSKKCPELIDLDLLLPKKILPLPPPPPNLAGLW